MASPLCDDSARACCYFHPSQPPKSLRPATSMALLRHTMKGTRVGNKPGSSHRDMVDIGGEPRANGIHSLGRFMFPDGAGATSFKGSLRTEQAMSFGLLEEEQKRSDVTLPRGHTTLLSRH